MEDPIQEEEEKEEDEEESGVTVENDKAFNKGFKNPSPLAEGDIFPFP